MKLKLPLFGEILTGNDTKQPQKIIEVNKDSSSILGGFFENSVSKLSNEKSISKKLLLANKSWVYRNNDVIAKEVSGLCFELYQVNLKNGKEEYVEVDDHPLLQILDKFNGSTTKSDALYITQSHKKLTGDAFWLLDADGVPGTPSYKVKNIFILQPDKVKLKIGNPTDATDELVEAYEYNDLIDGKKVSKVYKPEEIIHFKTPNPNNMFRGYGAVEAAAETIDLDTLTNEVTKKFFQNGAITNFVLSTEGRITDEQLKRLKAELRAAYSGASKAFQTMILGGGLKPNNISFTNKDLEFMSQLEWYRDKIMVIFGNTKASLGIIDDVNRASHESSIISWKRNSVKPDMESIVNTLNEFLVPKFSDKLILGFDDPVPEDRKSIIDEVTSLIGENVITVNEARTKLGYDEISGQDELREPVSYQVPEPLKSVNLKSHLRRLGFYKKKEKYLELKKAAIPMAKQLLKAKKTKKEAPEVRRHPAFTNEIVARYYQKQIKIVEVLEARFQNTVEQYIKNVTEKAIASLDNEISKSAKKELFDEDEFIVQATVDFRPILTEVAVAAGQQAYNLIGLDDPYLPLDMRKTIERNIEKFAASMLATDKDVLTDIISSGVSNGESIAQIRSAITQHFDEFTKVQAERITRTEVIRVANQATVDAFEQSGVVEGKQWLTAGDDRVDEDCAAYEGKVVKDLDGNFYSPEEFADGDPPLHPNCRCVVLPIVTNEKAFKRFGSVEREVFKNQIKKLEAMIDKRTKAYKEIKEQQLEGEAYIKALENHLGVSDELSQTK